MKVIDKKQVTNKMIYIIIICILTVLIFISYFFSIGKVSGISMKPNIYHKDNIIKLRYPKKLDYIPKRYSVITFKSPMNPKESLAKRVIGLPNDEINIEKGLVYLNGKQLDEYYLEPDTNTRSGRYSEWVVPEGHVFVLGDNRNPDGSSDSRSYGFIPLKDITGYIVFVYYPYTERWGFIK